MIARGNVEIYYNNYILTADEVVYDQTRQHADGGRQRRAEGAERQHRPRRPLHADGRFPRRLRPVAVDRRHRRHAHRRRARDAARRQHHRVRPTASSRPARTTDGMPPLWCVERGNASSTIRRRDHQLPGRLVRAVRRADPLPALLPARRPVGEAQVGLPDAAAYGNSDNSRLQDRRFPTTSRWRRTTTSRSTRCTPRKPGRPVAGRLAAPPRRTASTTSRSPASIRTPPTCRRRSPTATSTTAGAAASRPRACSRSAAGGSSAGT